VVCRRKHRHPSSRTEEYATGEQFLRLFAEELNELYLLSFLLTASHEGAERCFVAGLDQCLAGNPVSQAWARSWARRIIVRNAVRMLAVPADPAASTGPDSGRNPGLRKDEAAALSAQDARFAPILALGNFERLVFVLSVLERYSDQDCAALLGTSRHAIVDGRLRALRQIANGERQAVTPPVSPVQAMAQPHSA